MSITVPEASPFDAIKQARPDGSEFWSARDLADTMTYDQWRNFAAAIDRARISLANQGEDPEDHIAGASKMVEVGSGALRSVDDFHLTRYGAYIVVMNGDPRKPEVAAAQAYFAIKTREAEVGVPASVYALPQSFAEALRELASTVEKNEALAARVNEVEEQVAELAPAAKAWADIATADGSWSVGDAAQMLCSAGVMTGRTRLFGQLDDLGWTYVQGNERHIKQTARDSGLLVLKAYAPRYKPNGERIQINPQIRVTGKGLDRLVRELGKAA